MGWKPDRTGASLPLKMELTFWRKWFYPSFLKAESWKRRLAHRLTPRGQLLVCCLCIAVIPGVNTRWNVAYQFLCLMIGLVVVSCSSLPFFRPRGRVHRHLKGFAVAGETFSYHLSWTEKNESGNLAFCDRPEARRPPMGLFLHVDEDDQAMNAFDRTTGYRRFRKLWDRDNPPPSPLVELGDSSNKIDVEITPPRRGLMSFEEVQVYREDPLGFFRSQRRHTLKGELLVLPRAYSIPNFEMPSKGQLDRQTETLSLHVGDSGEFVSLREYRRGDSLKHIHWKSSARSGELHVRQYCEEQGLSFGVVLDTALEADREEDFEHTVSLAAGLLDVLSTGRHRVELLFVGAQGHRITTGRNGGSLLGALKELSSAELKLDPGLERLKEAVTPTLEGLSGLIFLTSSWEMERQNLVSSWLGRGLPTVVALVNEAETQLGPMASTPARWLHFHPSKIEDELYHWAGIR